MEHQFISRGYPPPRPAPSRELPGATGTAVGPVRGPLEEFARRRGPPEERANE